MTFTGKILVVLNLIMGIFFMGFAMIVYQTRVDLRSQLSGRDATISKLTADQTNVKAELDALRADKDKLVDDQAQLTQKHQQEIANMETATNALRSELNEFRNRVTRDETVASKATDNQNIRNEEIDQLRKFREELIAQKSTLLTENSNLKDELQQKTNDLTQALARNEEILGDFGELERYISVVQQNYKVPGPEELLNTVVGEQAPPPPPKVEGIVTRRDKEGRFYQISLGSDDGIKPGQQLEVWRQKPEPKYLGKVKVSTTEATTSVVTPVNLHGLIQPNDRVGSEIMVTRSTAN